MELLSAVVRIILIDIVLSGDNAVVIGLAAHGLPRQQRKLALVVGGGGAVAIRIIGTALTATFLQIPGLKIFGGALLIWIAFKLLKEEEQEHERAHVSSSLRGAILTILLADFVMSLDNVLAVAAVADKDLSLLVLGLMLSMAIVIFIGGIVSSLLDRLWWLAYLGSATIAWTGADIIVDDGWLRDRITKGEFLAWLAPIVAVAIVVTFSHWFHRGKRRGTEKKASLATTDISSES